MTLDPRWLEILRASGWHTAAIAAACGLFLLAGHWEWLPPLEGWIIQVAAFGFLLSGCLTFATAIISYRKYRARKKDARPVHYEPIASECRWGLAKQLDNSFSTQIVGKFFVSNLTDQYKLDLLPTVDIVSPKFKGEVVSNTASIDGKWGYISPGEVGEATIMILAKGTVGRWKRRELPVTVIITSHPPSRQRVRFRCRPMHPPELVR
jgi:hypothetical protein